MYTRVESKFWQDEKMRAVSDDARYLMLYLLTSPHRNLIGFYFLPSPYACFDLGWDDRRFQKAMQELLDVSLIRYDKQAHVVLVKNYLKHNPLENPNQVKSAIEKIKEIPKTQLLQDFLELVEQLDKPLYKPLIEHLHKRLSQQGTGTGSEYINNIYASADAEDVCESVPAEKPSDTTEDGGAQPPKKPKGVGKDGYTPEFEEFWKIYPRKVEKKRAFRVWKARLREGIKPETLIQACMNYASYCFGSETRYIKHASTFLGPDKPYEEYVNGVPEVIEEKPKIRDKPRRDNFMQRQYDDSFFERIDRASIKAEAVDHEAHHPRQVPRSE